MANLFFINGGVNNNYTNANNWSSTDGGVHVAESVPTSSDDVFFTTNSPNCTLDNGGNRFARNLTFSGYSNTITFTNTIAINGNLILSTGMTFSGTSALSWNTAGNITTNGKLIPQPLTFNGAGTYNLFDNLNTNNTFTMGASIIISGSGIYDIIFSGSSILAGAQSLTYDGNILFPAGMRSTHTGTITLNSISGKTIMTNGCIMNSNVTFNGVGGSWTLLDDWITTPNLGTWTLTNGSFDANNFNVKIRGFSLSNSNVRTLTMGSGIWTITGVGTVWDSGTITNLTYNTGTGKIIFDAGLSTATRAHNSSTMIFNDVEIVPSLSTFQWSGNNTRTFNTLKYNVKLFPQTMIVVGGVGLTANNFDLKGKANSPLTIQSSNTTNYVLGVTNNKVQYWPMTKISRATLTQSGRIILTSSNSNQGNNIGLRFVNQDMNGFSQALTNNETIYGWGGHTQGFLN